MYSIRIQADAENVVLLRKIAKKSGFFFGVDPGMLSHRQSDFIRNNSPRTGVANGFLRVS